MRYWPALVMSGAVLASACQRGATIEGDLSLGATKGGFRTVALARNPADSLLTAIDGQCLAEHAEIDRRSEGIRALQAAADRFRRTQGKTSVEQVALGDSADKYRRAASDEQQAMSMRPDTNYQKNVALVRAATDAQVEADINGHFRFAKRPKGTYVLYAEWPAAGDKEFLAQVDARSGGTKTQNLDQSTVSTRLHCR